MFGVGCRVGLGIRFGLGMRQTTGARADAQAGYPESKATFLRQAWTPARRVNTPPYGGNRVRIGGIREV